MGWRLEDRQQRSLGLGPERFTLRFSARTAAALGLVVSFALLSIAFAIQVLFCTVLVSILLIIHLGFEVAGFFQSEVVAAGMELTASKLSSSHMLMAAESEEASC